MKILIRDGRGTNILRLKFSETISEQTQGLTRINYQNSNASEQIGQKGWILVKTIREVLGKKLLISTRPRQIILNLGIPNKWSLEDELCVLRAVEKLLKKRGQSVEWSIKREIQDTQSPYFLS